MASREKNDDIYIKCHEEMVKLVPLENELHKKKLEVVQLTKENTTLKTTKNFTDQQNEEYKQKIFELQSQIESFKKNKKLAEEQLVIINQNLI